MSKQVLDIEQMKHLKELGVVKNASNVFWVKYVGDEHVKLKNICKCGEFLVKTRDKTSVTQKIESCEIVPAFTLQDILDILPSTIDTETTDEINEYWLEFGVSERNKSYWFVQYRSVDDKIYVIRDIGTPIDSAYEMLCWCIENGYVKTNKKE